MQEDYKQYKVDNILDSPIDERDVWYSDICKSTISTPINEYNIEYQFDARNQDKTGTCAFQSVTSTVEIIKNTKEYLSEGFLNAMRSSYDCYLATGAITREIVALACKCGFITKKEFPNLEDYPTIEESFNKLKNKDELIKKAKNLKCQGYCRLTVDDVVNYLINENKPIVLTTKLRDSFYATNYPSTDGVVPFPPKGDKIYGHAMVIVGFKYINGQLYFKVLNSWGRFWGVKGYCYLNAKSTEINELWGFTDQRVIETPREKEYLYRLQLGAFSKYENCVSYCKELNNKGIATCVKSVNGLYKIQVGCFKSKSNCINYQQEIKNKGYDCFIVTEEI